MRNSLLLLEPNLFTLLLCATLSRSDSIENFVDFNTHTHRGTNHTKLYDLGKQKKNTTKPNSKYTGKQRTVHSPHRIADKFVLFIIMLNCAQGRKLRWCAIFFFYTYIGCILYWSSLGSKTWFLCISELDAFLCVCEFQKKKNVNRNI